MSIHFFSSYTQAPGDAGPRVTRAFLTAKISKLQEATRIPPYTVRIPSQDPSRIPPYTVRIPSVYHHGPRIPPCTVRIRPVYHTPPPTLPLSSKFPGFNFFSFPLSSFQGFEQGRTNKRRRSTAQFKFCGAMGKVQSCFLSRL